MRVSVGMIAGQIGAGVSIEELLADYPYLERLCLTRKSRCDYLFYRNF
ncbi:DUF433 domain-containing protein [Breznakiellaceae bacterium SP9]